MFLLKADKVNRVVILGKEDYYEMVDNMITNELYKLIQKIRY